MNWWYTEGQTVSNCRRKPLKITNFPRGIPPTPSGLQWNIYLSSFKPPQWRIQHRAYPAYAPLPLLVKVLNFHAFFWIKWSWHPFFQPKCGLRPLLLHILDPPLPLPRQWKARPAPVACIATYFCSFKWDPSARVHMGKKRTANRLFLGSEHRGFQLINSIKNEPKNVYLFLSIFLSFSPYKKRIARPKMGKKWAWNNP